MAQRHRHVLRRDLACALASVLVGLSTAPAAAQTPPPPPPSVDEPAIVILPTLTPTGEIPTAIELHRPDMADGVLLARARELDLLLRDTAQDLGFMVTLSAEAPSQEASERALVQRSAGSDAWYVSPRLEIDGGQLLLRLLVVPAGKDYALVRTERTDPAEFQVRAVVMLRDLLWAGQGTSDEPCETSVRAPIISEPREKHSQGRAILAVHAAVFGGYVGYSLQKASGNDEDRLIYPLMALGTGVGLGGSLIIAEEWDIGLGDAWYMSAGAVWPTFGGLMLARGRDVKPESDRYAWGIGGGLAGITLASVSLSFAGMAEGGAAVAPSGGVICTGLGAGTEMAIRANTDVTPYEGLGYGALGGVLLGGVLSRGIEESPSRIMMIDVGVGLGALSFAAAGSPLLIGETTETRERGWVLLTMSGAVAGGAAAYWMTDRGDTDVGLTPIPISGQPMVGLIGQSQRPDGSVVPAYGAGWAGTF